MARKFIITPSRFVMGNVDFHKELVPRMAKDDEPVLGGGRWETDKEKRVLFLWGISSDFGFAQPEQIKKAIESPETWISQSLLGWKVMHSGLVSNDLPSMEHFTDLTVVSEPNPTSVDSKS
jgi:hypothetical protein